MEAIELTSSQAVAVLGSFFGVLLLFRQRFTKKLAEKEKTLGQLSSDLRKAKERSSYYKSAANIAMKDYELEAENREGILQANKMLREENEKYQRRNRDLEQFKNRAASRLRDLVDQVAYFDNFGAKFYHEAGASIREIQNILSSPEASASIPDGKAMSKRLSYISELADLMPRLDLKSRVAELADVEQSNLTVVADRILGKYKNDSLIVEDVEKSLVIAGSPYHLEYLIVNLLRNAFAAADKVKDGEVHVRIQRIEGMAQVQIVNDGTHIDKEVGEHIYNLGASFRQEHREGNRHLGYGLYLARQIAEGLGGNLEHENHVKTKGIMRTKTDRVVFCLKVPLLEEAPE